MNEVSDKWYQQPVLLRILNLKETAHRSCSKILYLLYYLNADGIEYETRCSCGLRRFCIRENTNATQQVLRNNTDGFSVSKTGYNEVADEL